MAGALGLALVAATMAFAQPPAQPAAPESPPAPRPSWMEYQTPYVNQDDDISNPHLMMEEITDWAQQRAAEVLSLSPTDYRDKLADFKKYFIEGGWQHYADYIREKKLLSMVTEGGYSSSTIVDNAPEVINHGAVGGVYHWVVKMPITISFFKKDKNGANVTSATGKNFLYMDISRVEKSGEEGVIAIARWKVQ